MESYDITLGLFGLVILLTAWIPMAFRRLPLSLPIFCIAIGALADKPSSSRASISPRSTAGF